eukprot:scaffold1653_cov389-Prasinococcus_capsulatus_cf.AAC.19
MHDDLTRYRNGEVDELSDELKVLMHGDPDDNPNGPVKTEYHGRFSTWESPATTLVRSDRRMGG